MRKVYELDSQFYTGEATVQPVMLWANGRLCRESFSKTASEATEYIKAVEPKPGMSIVLVLALGAYETYDLNRNGDGFNEFPYKTGFKPSCGCCQAPDGWVASDELLTQHYKSFEEHGKMYRHHQNKDPTKACGDVLKSFWNPLMHRVELLTGLRNELAPDLAERIAAGEYPAVSMGCRIKYDVCTVCGHRSPTRAQYCDHLKFKMRQVMPNGLRAGALNPSPKFFDISWVIKPADLTGFMMKKVADDGAYELRYAADLGTYLDRVDEKRAALQKVADIDKVVRGLPVDHKTSPLTEAEARLVRDYHKSVSPAIQQMPDIDPTTLTAMSKYPVAEVLSTLTSAGVILTTPEFIKLIVEKLAPGTQVPESTLDLIVAMQGHLFDLFAQHPQMLDQLIKTRMFDIRPENVKPDIGVIAEQYLEKRSTISNYLSRTLIPRSLRDEDPHYTDVLNVTDAADGAKYQTNRGAAVQAHDAIAKKQLAKIIGGAALLGAGYKAVSGMVPEHLRPLAMAATGVLGYHHLQPDFGPHYMTDEGVSIPKLTELHKVGNSQSIGLPILGSAALVAALGHDYESRLRKGHDVNNPDAPIHEKLFNRMSQLYADHPALGFLGNLGAYGVARQAISKFGEYMGDILDKTSADSVQLADVDIDRAATKLGSAVFR